MKKKSVVLVSCAAMLGAPSASQTPLSTELVVDGLEAPVALAVPPGDDARLFVVEQPGRIRIVAGGALLPTPFLDIEHKVDFVVKQGEQGLFDLAFDPGYETNGVFYVSYTSALKGFFSCLTVERYRVGPDPDVADPAGTVILSVDPLGGLHNGGCLEVGPDGKLYVSTGDGGLFCQAQDGSSLVGKLLRLERDGGAPPDNPFVDDPLVRDEVYALGLRNPWRFSFDRDLGDLYLADVGSGGHEEVNFAPAASTGGENFGWPMNSGFVCTMGCPPVTCSSPGLVDPIECAHADDLAAIIGGYVYRGCAIPDLAGTYFYADWSSGRVFSFRYDGAVVSERRDRTAELNPPGPETLDWISSFGEDAEGELYLVGHEEGALRRIVAAVPSPFVDLGHAKAGTGGLVPELAGCGLLGSGDVATLQLRDALPEAPAILLVAATANPLLLFGGTILPDLATGSLTVLATDGDGAIDVSIAGGGGPLDLFAQVGIFDPGASSGLALSNALSASFGP